MSDWEIELPLVIYARDGSRPVRTRTLRVGERGLSTVVPASAGIAVGDRLMLGVRLPLGSWLAPTFRQMPSAARVVRTGDVIDGGEHRVGLEIAFSRAFRGPWSAEPAPAEPKLAVAV